MNDPLKKILEPIEELQNIRGVDLPIGLEFLQLVVTGPPGAGKSYYIEQIGGWPNEGYLDLTQKGWWKDQSLVYRPREVHLGLPFKGFREALTVFDKEWLHSQTPLELEVQRIQLPPVKQYFLQTDWRNRYIFEFLIPSPATIYEQRLARQSRGYFPVDENLNLEMVRLQVAVYREIALYLHRAGLNVYLRKGIDRPPMRIAEKGVATVPRWTIDRRPRRPSLRTMAGWKWLFHRHYPIRWLTLSNQPATLDGASRIAHDGRSFDLILGDFRLRFQPEILIGVKRQATQKHWLMSTEQGCSNRNINGFVRIRVGETIVVGRESREYRELFRFTDSVASRHVSITNRRGDLILTPLVTTPPTSVQRIDDHDYRDQLELGRLQSLFTIRRFYGKKIHPLPPEQALATIKELNRRLPDEPYRPRDRSDRPGGLVELSTLITPVIVGDLHARVDNLLKIITENCLLECLRNNTAALILLGDAAHSEELQEMERFESSMCIMDLIFRLKLEYFGNVFYLRGNHDSFAPEINKNGVLQGVLFQEALRRLRGEEYLAEIERFYDNLPYMISGDSFIACHAGPPRGTINRDELINIRERPELARDLTNNRLQRPNHLAGYTKGGVKRLRNSLNCGPKTRFIVGHTPMDPFNSFWLHAGTIKNHHIIYSAHNDGPSILIRTGNGFTPITFPAEPISDIINDIK